MPITVVSSLVGLGPHDSDPELKDGIARPGPYDDDEGSGGDRLPERKLPLTSPPSPSKEFICLSRSV